jgi:hypothetical protein
MSKRHLSLVPDTGGQTDESPSKPSSARDFGVEAQEAVDAHIGACWEAFYAYEENGEDVESPSFGPFDGCETCVTREMLYAAWPVIEESVRHDLQLERVLELLANVEATADAQASTLLAEARELLRAPA